MTVLQIFTAFDHLKPFFVRVLLFFFVVVVVVIVVDVSAVVVAVAVIVVAAAAVGAYCRELPLLDAAASAERSQYRHERACSIHFFVSPQKQVKTKIDIAKS